MYEVHELYEGNNWLWFNWKSMSDIMNIEIISGIKFNVCSLMQMDVNSARE